MAAAALAFQAPASAATSTAPAAPAGGNPVEAKYLGSGPSAVTIRTVTASGGSYRLYYPTNLDGAKLPIVTWGNGTNATAATYDALLRHVASWGYAVVASNSTQTGTGREMVAGARYLAAENDAATSPLKGKLDTDKIAAVGHSQGAGGAINATKQSGDLITTTVPIGLPITLFPVNGLRTGTAFFLGGSADVLTPAAGVIAGYNGAAVPAVVAIRRGATHLTEPLPSTSGGYLVAWLKYQLNNDSGAAAAFVGSSPELGRNGDWQNFAAKSLGSSD